MNEKLIKIGDKTYKEAQVILNAKSCHMYIVTLEEIQLGDYYSNGVTIFKCNNLKDVNFERYKYLKKVIASTDPSLDVSRPSSDFIKKYCELNGDIKDVLVEYYRNTKEDEPHYSIYDPRSKTERHETEKEYLDELKQWKKKNPLILKVVPDNTISIIKKPEDKLYTKEELESYMLASALAFIGFNDEANTEEDIKDWIKTHIK